MDNMQSFTTQDSHPINDRLDDVLNIAAVCPATQCLGPGMRAVVWVQGCLINCPGCIAPDWMAIRPAHLVDVDLLAKNLMKNSEITGITLSGGEPMLQALAMVQFLHQVKLIRDVNVICFTGYRLQQLMSHPPVPGVFELLDELDVLIDGPYLAGRNVNIGLKGSANQKIHYITNRLRNFNLDDQPRKAEIYIEDGQAFLVGVPPRNLEPALLKAISRANDILKPDQVSYERV
jgi:anaerobic ribonucleoside-triphosphate reductase activating protein